MSVMFFMKVGFLLCRTISLGVFSGVRLLTFSLECFEVYFVVSGWSIVWGCRVSLFVVVPWVLLCSCFRALPSCVVLVRICTSLVDMVALFIPGLWFVVSFLSFGFYFFSATRLHWSVFFPWLSGASFTSIHLLGCIEVCCFLGCPVQFM